MNCDCFTIVAATLAARGFGFTQTVTATRLEGDKLTSQPAFPVKRINGRRRRDDERVVFLNYCPFCGKRTAAGSGETSAKEDTAL